MTSPTPAACAHLVDDDEAIRDALDWLFASRQVAHCLWSSGEALLEAWRPDWAGCIVLDIRMQGMSGLACFDELIARHNTLPVIFITGHGDVPMAVGALKKGAFDFLEKPFDDNQLVDTVLRALAHHASTRSLAASRDEAAARHAQLTAREREVMARIVEGKLNKVIADELGIAMRTVEVHRARIFEKMGVRSAVELVQAVALLRRP